jgi:hypothetical protein
MRLRVLVIALATLVSSGACAAREDRPSSPPAGGSDTGGTRLGRGCVTSSGVTCILEVQAPLDGPCSCATAYGREAGKVVP